MKVLFAINDESVSTKIVKTYQKQYKEIISYKNVYYFNAIIKELQKNKTYDRIVISEDLEEFSSTNHTQRDKFIFEKLDSISDEAVSQDGSDIPIILICSERRNKSEEILVKVFGIGIYNAMLGDDRSIDEVCRLINKPRSKKEAKSYYKIDSDDVSYEKENDNEVSETEIQNILIHFKRLGSNEEKYATSFKNIVSQYNNEQMKVIISVLPENVKEILEDVSPEYRKMALPNGSVAGKTRKRKKADNTKQKLLKSDNDIRLSRPVVVPSAMETNVYKKVSSKRKEEIEDLDEEEELPIEEEKPKRRGRPRKVVEEPKTKAKPQKKNIEEDYEDYDDEDEMQISLLPGFDDSYEEETKNEKKYNDDMEDYEDYDEDVEDSYNKNNYSEDDFEEDDDDYDYEEKIRPNKVVNRNTDTSRNNSNYSAPRRTETSMEKYEEEFDDDRFESLLSSDKKVVAFVGTSKNGTSFIVNNIAQALSELGINTAILDATLNKNSYYIYTKNDEELRQIAINSFQNLIDGNSEGIRVNNNLTVYTTIPNQYEQINSCYSIMETLVKNHSLVLIDCDFSTPSQYFDKAQELYLIQSMDVLTIQPLTSFLRDLKVKNILDERKIRIVLNKFLKIKGVNSKNIIGGMSNYNDPEMAFMTELFDKNIVKLVAEIPFDEDVYARYLEGLVECDIKSNGYPKEFKQKLVELAQIVYPLMPNSNAKIKKKNKGDTRAYSDSFSSGMNSTLNNMRKKY